MDSNSSILDVIRCDLCDNNTVESYCDFCLANLCKPCIGEHISDGYDKHKIVSFRLRLSTLFYPKCSMHPNKTCELLCKESNKYICTICCASGENKGHEFIVLEDLCKSMKIGIKMDIRELEKNISPTYVYIANDIENQIANLDEEYDKLTNILSNQEETWRREIDCVVKKIKNEINDLKLRHLDVLKTHLNEIKQIEKSIQQSLSALKELEISNAVSEILDYKPKNEEFIKLPSKLLVSLPSFHSKTITSEQIYEMFGSLKPFDVTTAKNGYTLKEPKD